MNHRRIFIATALAAAAASAVALATPPVGVLFNRILSFGVMEEPLDQNLVRVGPDGLEWKLKLRTQGASDVYMQEVAFAPGGYSGWHTHPGLLVLTVVAGELSLFDEHCNIKVMEPGDVFTEDFSVHNLVNTGTVEAQAKAFYIVQKGKPRREEASAPACGPAIGLP